MNGNENVKKNISEGLQEPAEVRVLPGRIAVIPDVSCRVEDDGYALLFNPDTDNSVLIDRSGLLIWKYIEEPRSIADIVAYLKTCYTGSPAPDTIREEVEAYLHELIPEFAKEIA